MLSTYGKGSKRSRAKILLSIIFGIIWGLLSTIFFIGSGWGGPPEGFIKVIFYIIALPSLINAIFMQFLPLKNNTTWDHSTFEAILLIGSILIATTVIYVIIRLAEKLKK